MKNLIKKCVKRLRGEQNLEKMKKMGLKIGEDFLMMENCNIDYSHCFLVSIGNKVTLAPGVRILAHDASTKNILNYTKIGKVEIGNQVFIGADSIIMPNVHIGNDVIIGAGSVVTKSIPDGQVAAGNPAKIICGMEEYIEKEKRLMKESNCWDSDWTLRGNLTEEKKETMIKTLEKGIGFIE